jgi:hypothetical protein
MMMTNKLQSPAPCCLLNTSSALKPVKLHLTLSAACHPPLLRLSINIDLPCSVTNTNAPNCDPQLTGSLTITATGLLTVNTGTINNNSNNSSSSSTGAVKAAASTAVISSFNTVTPMIVDGVYSSTRPDTLLSSIVGFKRGSLDVPNVKRTDSGSYTGSMTLSLFKGPVL